eukprot:TRINITY_DN2234_c0_g1_i1.p1 TRINITY_DN2234_c0_g1~~TRINITY_DN2234_c0_g1_i1.p1  ORF type:complete len:263 (-),score=65.14 TRINITY_DN2234_c0_g1_i1:189-941(-)
MKVLCYLFVFLICIFYSSATNLKIPPSKHFDIKYSIGGMNLNVPVEQCRIIVGGQNKKFNCCLPIIENLTDTQLHVHSPDENTPTMFDVLSLLDGQCALFVTGGYHDFQLCFNKDIQQLHFDDGKLTAKFIVGEPEDQSFHRYNIDFDDQQQRNYLSFKYTNGEFCPSINGNRSAEVRVFCGRVDKFQIKSVKEIGTCTYLIEAISPLLCELPVLKPRGTSKQSVQCQMILGEGEKIILGGNNGGPFVFK